MYFTNRTKQFGVGIILYTIPREHIRETHVSTDELIQRNNARG